MASQLTFNTTKTHAVQEKKESHHAIERFQPQPTIPRFNVSFRRSVMTCHLPTDQERTFGPYFRASKGTINISKEEAARVPIIGLKIIKLEVVSDICSFGKPVHLQVVSLLGREIKSGRLVKLNVAAGSALIVYSQSRALKTVVESEEMNEDSKVKKS